MTKQAVFVGIDPGEKGAICAVLPSEQKAVFMDTTEKPKVIHEWFQAIKEQYDLRVIMVEDVGPIPKSSAGSNFKFGYNAGVVNTLALTAGVMVDKVRPKKWQSTVGVSISSKIKDPSARKKATKNAVADLCDRLYPQVNIRGPKGGLLDGKSDALMIAHYAVLTHPVHQ